MTAMFLSIHSVKRSRRPKHPLRWQWPVLLMFLLVCVLESGCKTTVLTAELPSDYDFDNPNNPPVVFREEESR